MESSSPIRQRTLPESLRHVANKLDEHAKEVGFTVNPDPALTGYATGLRILADQHERDLDLLDASLDKLRDDVLAALDRERPEHG